MHNRTPMQRTLNADSVKLSLQGKGWSQKELAAVVGVSAQSVTTWLKGADFPRPGKLLKLAVALYLMGGAIWYTMGTEASWFEIPAGARVAKLTLVILAGATAYFASLGIMGFRPRDFMRHEA